MQRKVQIFVGTWKFTWVIVLHASIERGGGG